VRRERFLDDAYAGYSGWRHAARLEAGWHATEALTLTAGYLGGVLAAREPALGFLEHGPRAEVELRLGRRVRLGAEVGACWRRYGALDAALGARREDSYREAGAVLGLDVGEHWSVQAWVDWRGASSGVSELAHERLVGGLGLEWAEGWE
jgi:hypothetical protein